MHELDVIWIFLEPLNRAGIPYMVSGSVASIFYGEPRMTHDVDLVIALEADLIGEFLSLFPDEEFYCPPESVMRTEVAREARGHFNLIHHATGFKADFYPVGQDPLHQWAMAKRQVVAVDEHQVFLAPPEYVILRKLQFYQEDGSDKHLRDIRGILALSGQNLNVPELETRISELGLTPIWEKLIQ